MRDQINAEATSETTRACKTIHTNHSTNHSNKVSTSVVKWLSYSQLDPRFAGSNPAGIDEFFQSVKILSMTSFGREVKPLVLCRRFTACKRTSSQN